MKEEALKLADRADSLAIELPADWSSGEPKNVMTDISAMIRRLVEELDYLKDQISFYELKDLGNQTKPLSDDEIRQLYIEMMEAKSPHSQSFFGFARAIEERHGIK